MAIPSTMRAMVLSAPGQPLQLRELPVPRPGSGQVLMRVLACGVCRTDLHIVDGELTEPKLPLIPGHEIVGILAEAGAGVTQFGPGARIGVPWLGWTCGRCAYCQSGRENLCAYARFTGYTIDGGYAEYALADQRYCFSLPEQYGDAHAAPLLCAGLIGYRTYRLAGCAPDPAGGGEPARPASEVLSPPITRVGIYGFGAAAHIITQVAIHQGKQVYAFTRAGDTESQAFARRLGAVWAGDSSSMPPEELDAALIFAPVGALLPAALRATARGGTVVCGGIHMSDIPSFPYKLLWGERVVRSVANLTRRDGEELLAIALAAQVKTEIETFPLVQANEALDRLRAGKIQGAAVLTIERT
jgi:alcohol dehydrogenase, propanol-preferring